MVSIVTNPGARELIKPPVVEILRNLITTDKTPQIHNLASYKTLALPIVKYMIRRAKNGPPNGSFGGPKMTLRTGHSDAQK